jgi:pimeloyl-ACP methyl ester carboxylesterase
MSPLPPVIMIHGAFCGGWVFDDFRRPFEAAGHTVLTPDLGGGASAAGLSMLDYAKEIVALCEACETPPILIGHSLGGLAVQLAAASTPLSALILLAPSAPWGIYGTTMEEGVSAVSLYALGPFWLQAIPPDYQLASGYSLNRLDRETRHALYERMRPESGRALWETLNWWLDPFMSTRAPTSIEAPVLAFAGGRDVIHPPATVRQTATRLGGETVVFDQMSHWLPGEPGWDDVAAHCLTWLSGRVRSAA